MQKGKVWATLVAAQKTHMQSQQNTPPANTIWHKRYKLKDVVHKSHSMIVNFTNTGNQNINFRTFARCDLGNFEQF